MDNGASVYRRYLEGDENAFDEILKDYRDSLTFFINRFVQDAAAAEDLAIDVFLVLLVHKHRYNFKVSLKTYLFMIGRSRALDYIRHRGKLTTTELTEAEEMAADDILPEDTIVANEQQRAVNRALIELPDEMRTVVHLIYFEEFSYDETAKVMKKNRKQIDNLLYRAKKELRKILGEEDGIF